LVENRIICKRFAVLRAAIRVCLDMPNEKAVLYLADSSSASINNDEHLSERRAAIETAVIKLATFSGRSVGELMNEELWYVDNCSAMIFFVSVGTAVDYKSQRIAR
jgi:hypothetical protein